jgi:starch synthase
MSRVLMVAPEAAPFVKTGGLGDVMGSLPAALARRGEEVAVVLPRYRVARLDSSRRISNEMVLHLGHRQFVVAIDQADHNGVCFFLIDCPPLYDRAGIYDEGGVEYADNHIRFGLLNQAALSIARNIFQPGILHGHDWQAGLLAPYLRTGPTDPTLSSVKCVLTIHNLGYQGNFPPSALGDLGLDRALLRPDGIEFFGRVSLLKAGIVWSDAITTVSPTYAREIQTPEYGFGFDGLLRSRAHALSGILNGVDYSGWNPETDPHIRAHYSAGDLSGKRASKLALLEEMGLPLDTARPLIGIVSRFAAQKGFDLLAGIAAELAGENMAMVVLGSGERRLEEMFRSLAAARPDKFAVRVGHDEVLAHRIEAGSDMFLMPSHYEPCGLSQMYSLRYGTVPIVRATGGLEDTVDEETGFKFREYTPQALLGAIRAALHAWQDHDTWPARMRRGMAKDYSWDASAARYVEIYRNLSAH